MHLLVDEVLEAGAVVLHRLHKAVDEGVLHQNGIERAHGDLLHDEKVLLGDARHDGSQFGTGRRLEVRLIHEELRSVCIWHSECSCNLIEGHIGCGLGVQKALNKLVLLAARARAAFLGVHVRR